MPTKRGILCLIAIAATTSTTNGFSNVTTMTHIASCDLECSNGGYCTLVAGTEEDLGKMAQSGNLIEICVCRPGFTGLTCEKVDDECTLPDRTCHNKVPCIRQPDTGEWGCDCSIADSISEFAGRMCRKPITEYCTGKFDADSALSFCTNGGRCLADFIAAKIAPGDTTANKKFQHAGCKCPPDFDGPHCEHLRLEGDEEVKPSNQKISQQHTNGNNIQSPATLFVATMLLVSILVIVAVACLKRCWASDDDSITIDGTYIENESDFSDEEEEPEADIEDTQVCWSTSSGGSHDVPNGLETVPSFGFSIDADAEDPEGDIAQNGLVHWTNKSGGSHEVPTSLETVVLE